MADWTYRITRVPVPSNEIDTEFYFPSYQRIYSTGSSYQDYSYTGYSVTKAGVTSGNIGPRLDGDKIYIRLYSIDDNDDLGEYSITITYSNGSTSTKTLLLKVKLPAPSNMALVATSTYKETSLKVTGTEPKQAIILRYDLRYKKTTDSTYTTVSDFTLGGTITGLTAGTTYQASIMTKQYGSNSYYESSDWSDTATGTTLDTTAPTLTLNGSSSVTIEAGSSWTDPGYNASDNSGNVTVTKSPTSINTSAVSTKTITYTATDSSGNTTTVTRTVNIVDTTAPVITISNTYRVHTKGVYYSYNTGISVYDVTSTSLTHTGSVDSSTLGIYSLIFSATDSSGNAAIQKRQIVDVVVGGNISYSDTGVDYGTHYYKAVITEGSQEATSNTVSISRADVDAPVITLTGESSYSIEAGQTFSDPGATATDNLDPSVEVITTGTINNTTPGSYTLYYNATDSSGNAATTVTRTVTVVDTTPPTISLTGDNPLSIEAGSPFVEPGATASDIVDGSIEVSSTGTVNTSIPGTYTRYYNAVDSSGNAAVQVSRTVNVVDTTPPTITLTGSNLLTLEAGQSWTDPGATAADIVDGTVEVSSTGTVNTSVLGTYTRYYNATDSSGNSAVQLTRTVTVVDTTPPTLTLTGDASITLEVGSSWNDPGATATDDIDGPLEVAISGTVNLNTVGTYTKTYSATDSSGNITTKTRTINIVDTTRPVITLVGNNPITLEVNSTFTDPGATVTDNYDQTIQVQATGTVQTGTVGSYTRYYNATDSNGNAAAQVTRTVNVVDTTAPVITLIGNNPLTVEGGSTFVDPGATATDNYDQSVTVVSTGEVDTSTVGSYTRYYNAVDTHGNNAVQLTRTVTVVDTTAPTITLVGGSFQYWTKGIPWVDTGSSAVDTVDGTVTDTTTGSVDTTDYSMNELSYSAEDSAGNEATVKRRFVDVVVGGNVSYTDTNVPYGGHWYQVIITEGSQTATANTAYVMMTDHVPPSIILYGGRYLAVPRGAVFVDPGAIAWDNADSPVNLTGVIRNGSGTTCETINTSTAGVWTITYDSTDASGNIASSVVRTVFVITGESPDIEMSGDETTHLVIGDTWNEPGVTATDKDGNTLVISTVIRETDSDSVAEISTATTGSYLITYWAVDTEGRGAFATRLVVIDEPEITEPLQLSIKGYPVYGIVRGATWIDPGYSLVSYYSGETVAVTGSVDTSTVGIYTLTYTATDSRNNTITKTRKVYVCDPSAPKIVLNGPNPDYTTARGSYSEPDVSFVNSDNEPIVPTLSYAEYYRSDGVKMTEFAVPAGLDWFWAVHFALADGKQAIPAIRTIYTTGSFLILTGLSEVTLEVGSSWNDPGATAYGKSGTSVPVTTSGTVDTETVGDYTITYSATDDGITKTVTRTIHVVDTTPPVLTLATNSITLEAGSEYSDVPATATDNYDGQVTVTATITDPLDDEQEELDTLIPGTWTITYSATDSSGNEAIELHKTINVVDTTAPSITLVGNAAITLEKNSVWTDPGAMAVDIVDGQITCTRTIRRTDGASTTSASLASFQETAGTYTITYSATDSSGNTATVTRTVNIVEYIPPTLTLIGDESITIALGTTWSDPGATAEDEEENSLTDSIIAAGSVDTGTIGVYSITYSVTDQNDKTATKTRTVYVVHALSLVGSNPVAVTLGTAWSDPGAVTGPVNGIPTEIAITGSVNTSVAGTYTRTYTAHYANGGTLSVTRTANVVASFRATAISSTVIRVVYPALEGEQYSIQRREEGTGECQTIASDQTSGEWLDDSTEEDSTLTANQKYEYRYSADGETWSEPDAAWLTQTSHRTVTVVEYATITEEYQRYKVTAEEVGIIKE